jgi:iron complex outermembrane recepter protein
MLITRLIPGAAMNNYLTIGTLGMMITIPATSAWSGAADAADSSSSQLEEVIVTAQRRPEGQQTVPISMSVMSGQQLSQMQIADLSQATTFVPNISYQTSIADPTEITLSIRGIQTPGTQLVQDSAVPLYIDGVYIARTAGSNIATVDMQQLEVLRGPQGTLFGRNSVGGAVTVTTQKPTDKLEGSIEYDGGNFDTQNVTAIFNAPVSEISAVRLVYQHTQHGDYGKSPDGQGFNSLKQNYGRIGWRLNFSPDWALMLTADYMTATADPPLVKLGYYKTALPFNALLPALNGARGDLLSNYVNKGSFYQGYGTPQPQTTARESSVTGTLTGRIGEVNVKSISNYRGINDNRPVDLDGTPYPLINLIYQPINVHQLSEELQAFGTAWADRLNWISGVYYFRESGFQISASEALFPIVPSVSYVDYNATNTSSAVFAQLSYNLTNALKVTAGARYTEDKREIVYHDQTRLGGVPTCSLAPTVLEPGTFCDGPSSVNFHYIPWTLGLDFQANSTTLLYAKVSQSFRSGGYSQSTLPALGVITTVAPEKVLSPEVGFKLELLDRTLRLNGALFYAKYTNIQQQVDTRGPNDIPVAVQENAGDGRLYGGELEATALILGKLTLNAGLGLLDSRYTGGPFTGTRFLTAPSTTFDIGASYPFDISAGRLVVSADYGYKSDQWYVSPTSNAAVNSAIQQGGYGLLNAQTKYTLRSAPLWFSLWGRNIANKDYSTRALDFSNSLGATVYFPGTPRTYGASVGYNF